MNKSIQYRLAFITLILLIAYMLFVRICLIFSYSIDLDGAEFVCIHQVQRLLLGKQLYLDPTSEPFIVNIYMPLYYYLLEGVCRILQVQGINDLHSIYIAGRALSLFFFLLEFILLYFILAQYQLRNLFRWLLLALFMMLITGGFFIARMDGIKVFCFTVFFYCLIRYHFYPGSFWIALLSITGGALSVSFKQDSLIYTSICLGVLWLFKPGKKTGYFGLAFVAVNAAIMVLYYLVWGPLFLDNIFWMNFQVITDFKSSMNALIIFFSLVRIVPLMLIVFMNIYDEWKRREYRSLKMYIAVMTGLFFLISHFLMLRAGAYLNYTYDLCVLLVFSLAFYLEKPYPIPFLSPGFRHWLVVVYLTGLFASGFFIHSYYFSGEKQREYRKTFQECRAEADSVEAILQNEPVFLPDPYSIVYFGDRNLIYGYDYHADRFIQLLVGLKLQSKLLFFDSRKYDSCFVNGNVPYLIIRNVPNERDHVSEYYKAYRIEQETKNFVLYRYAGFKNIQ